MIAYDKRAVYAAAKRKRSGYLEAVLSLAVETDHQFLISDEAFFKLRKFDHEGLGTRIENRLKPLAKWVDKRLGTRLAKCAACSKRAKALNHIEQIARRAWRKLTASRK